MNKIIQFMRRNYKILMVIIALCIGLWSFIPREKSSDPEKDKMLIELLTFVIEKGHYSPAEINDDFSKSLFECFRSF